MLLQSIQPLSEPYVPSIGTGRPRWAGPKTSPHGWDMNCPCDVAAFAVFTAQVDHNHILLIPKLGHAWTYPRNPKNSQFCGNKKRKDHSFGCANQHERVS